jgi:hypothetical protein
MKKLTQILCCLLLMAHSAIAQSHTYTRTYGPSGMQCEAKEVLILPDANVLFVATITNSGQEDIWLVKTNTKGDTLWTKTLGNALRSERPESVIISSANQLMITGNSYSGAGNPDALLMCVDLSGKLLWEKNYGGAGEDFATAIKETTDGFVLGGATLSSSTAGDFDAWLVKVNSSGLEQWSKTFGGAEYDDCWDLELTPEGGFMLTGGTYSFASGMYDDAWLIKTDAAGVLLWRKCYGVADRVDWAWNLHPVKSGPAISGYVFTGVRETAENMPGAAYGNMHFVKVDLDGNVLWDKTIIATGYRIEGMDVKQLADSGFMISGYQFTTSARQLYMVRTDANGSKTWDTSVGNDVAYNPRALAVAADGSCYTVGSLASPDGSRYSFMAKFSGLPLSISNQYPINHPISIHPNPASGHVVISWPQEAKVSSVMLYDVSGRLLSSIEVSNSASVQINLEDMPAGSLVIKVQTANDGIWTKLIQHL